jgi:hypothetical protein
MTSAAAEYVPTHRGEPADVQTELEQTVKNILHDELAHFLSDVEFRLGRFAELERRVQRQMLQVVPDAISATHLPVGTISADRLGDTVAVPAITTAGLNEVPDGSVYAEDIVSNQHQITGYTVTANSPTAPAIAWTNVHVVYNGVDYQCAAGNTTLKYVYFVKPGSYTPGVSPDVALVTSDTKPTTAVLGAGGALIFINNAGTPISVLEASIPVAIADGSVDSSAIIAGAVGSGALATGAVIAGKIAAGGISASNQFATNVVNTAAIAPDAVTVNEIGPGAVDSTALGANAVVAGKVATGAINAAAQIANGVVGTAQIANTAIDSTKLANGAVGTTQLAGNAVDSTKLADGAVATSAKIAAGVVGATQIGSGAITPVKLNTLQHVLY